MMMTSLSMLVDLVSSKTRVHMVLNHCATGVREYRATMG